MRWKQLALSSDNWTTKTLGECAEWISGGTPRKSIDEYWGGEMPWVSSKELHARFIADAELKLTALGVNSGTRTVPAGATLMVVRSMALQNGMMIGLAKREVAFNQDVKGLVPTPKIDGQFLYYCLWGNAESLHALVDEASHGTKRLSTDRLKAFPIRVPPRDEQRRIVRVLGSLDNKIESNRRVAKTLEQLIATIFKARFVDFVGRDDFVLSETGRIPRGWAISPLGEVSSVLTRGRSPAYLSSGGVMVLNQRCIRDGRLSFELARRNDDGKVNSEDRRVFPGDLLINSTGVGTLGRMAQVRWLPEPSTVDGHVTIVRADHNFVTPEYLAMALIARQAEIESMGQGSTGQTELTRARLAEFPILIPPISEQREFTEAHAKASKTLGNLERNSQTLAETRDILLPRMISGELRIPDGAFDGTETS